MILRTSTGFEYRTIPTKRAVKLGKDPMLPKSFPYKGNLMASYFNPS